MIKHVNGCEVSRDDSVKLRCHPGATTEDIIDYVWPTARTKLDMIIIHTGTYDIENKVNTFQKIRKVITTIKEIDVNNEIQIAFSSVTHRDDQDFVKEIKEINRKLENLCKGKGIKFINNNNSDGSCLNRSKLHLNKSGTVLLVKRFWQAVKPNLLCNFNNSLADKTTNFASGKNTSNVSLLRNLRIKNPKNMIFSYISIRNKFYNLCDLISKNVDILSVTETKSGPSFPNSQFLVPSFTWTHEIRNN